MEKEELTRKQLIEFLNGELAHMNLDSVLKDFPEEHYNTRPPNVGYSFWHLLEHIRITQWDVLDFITNPDYKYMNWPEDYWPDKEKKVDTEEWDETISKFHADISELKKIVKDPDTDLVSEIPWGEGQTIFREIVLIVDHNSYHIGEFGILRQVVDNWD